MASISNETIYPSEWSDDQVMDVFFSPFRENRYVNPRSWDSKLNFWTDMIRKYCTKEKVLVFNARQLPGLFERNGKIPSCLNVVLDDLVKRGIVQPLSSYIASSSGWVSWSFDVLLRRPVRWGFQSFVKQPMLWAFSKLTGNDGNVTSDLSRPKSRDRLILDLPDEQFVIVDLVKSAAAAIFERHCMSVTCRLTDEVVAYHDLARRCKDICADEQSFDAALTELCQQKRCAVGVGSQGEKVIRMVSVQSEKVANISDSDMKIYRLKTAESKLEAAMQSTADEMEQCRISAKAYLKQGKKSAALKCLRRKKLLDARQTQHEQAVDKINSLLNMLQQTESQKQIIEAYSTGVQAFKGLKERYGLTEESIEDTMLQIQEVFDDNELINQSMAQPVPGDVDEDDLELELDELMTGNEATGLSTPRQPTSGRKTTEFNIFDLPGVPNHDPGRSPIGSTTTGARRILAD